MAGDNKELTATAEGVVKPGETQNKENTGATGAGAEATKTVEKPISPLEFLGAGLADDIRKTVEAEAAKRAPTVPAIQPATEGKKEGKEEAGKPKAPVKVKRVEATVREMATQMVNEELARRATTVPPLPPKKETQQTMPAPAQTDKPVLDEKSLSYEQRRLLRVVRHREEKEPTRKGEADKLLTYFRDVEDYVAKGKTADPDRTFDQDDHEFVEYVNQNRPVNLSDEEIDALDEDRVLARASNKVKQEMEGEVKALKQKATEALRAPEIDRRMGQFDSELAGRMKSDDKLENGIYERHRKAIGQISRTFLRLCEGVEELDQKNAIHAYLMNFRDQQADWFSRNGGERRERDGRMFITPAKFFEMQGRGEDVSRVWTLGVEDILTLLGAQAEANAQEEIKLAIKEREEQGWARQEKPKITQPEKIAKPEGGLVATTSPGPSLINPGTNTGGLTEAQKLVQQLGVTI